jgi:DNA adenine methylase
MMTKPFVKWVGGKTSILKQLVNNFPKNYDNYYEPFVGGGAVYFQILAKNANLNDSNGELINSYKIVKHHVEDLISELFLYENTKEFFMGIRAKNPLFLSPVERAARFIYLNKTCFNGLYRVNSKNQFNVPYGGYLNANFCDKKTLRDCSEALKTASLDASCFSNYLEKVNTNNTFVYLDPPYYPSENNSFVSYTKRGFGEKDHELLCDWYKKLDRKGVMVLLSNSDCDWTRLNYSKFRIIEVTSRRSVGSASVSRGKYSELLIANY